MLGIRAESRGDLDLAKERYERALALRETLAPGSEDLAWTLSNLGDVALAQGDVDAADGYFARCLTIQEALEPVSEDVASAVASLAEVAVQRGEVGRAETLLRRAAAIRERVNPDSLELAHSLSDVAFVLEPQGRIEEARSFLESALEIQLRRDPTSEDAATMLNNMGILDMGASDFEAAEQHYGEALAIRQRLAPESADVAQSLANIGNLALKRGDYETGRRHIARAVEIQRAGAPQSPQLAVMVGNLALIEMLAGNLAQAEELERESAELLAVVGMKVGPEVARGLLRRALISAQRGAVAQAKAHLEEAVAAVEASGKSSPLGPTFKVSLGAAASASGDSERGLRLVREALEAVDRVEGADVPSVVELAASVFAREGEWATAESLYRRALEEYTDRGTGGIIVASLRSQLGAAVGEQGRVQEAEAILRSAWKNIAAVLPGTMSEAAAMRALGGVLRRKGEIEAAAELLCGASTMANAQRPRIGGGDEARAAFTATVAEYHWDCQKILLELGRQEEAFGVVEESRARALLEMLAERQALLESGIPGPLVQERLAVNAEYDEVVGALGKLDPLRQPSRARELHERLGALTRRREDVTARIRQASPRLAALHYPKPLNAGGVRRVLDPGTVYLSYSVGPEKSWLYGSPAMGLCATRRRSFRAI
jgi:tetratricopeptide (TPR) repeat protein